MRHWLYKTTPPSVLSSPGAHTTFFAVGHEKSVLMSPRGARPKRLRVVVRPGVTPDGVPHPVLLIVTEERDMEKSLSATVIYWSGLRLGIIGHLNV